MGSNCESSKIGSGARCNAEAVGRALQAEAQRRNDPLADLHKEWGWIKGLGMVAD